MTVRFLLSLALSCGWTLRQLDVHNAFLNGRLSETVFMRQPPRYADSIHPDYVCHLQRSLHGLKQDPRAWFKRLHDFLVSVGFKSSKTDVLLFFYSVGDSHVFLLIRDLGSPWFFLSIETVPIDGGMILSQRMYMDSILKRAGMTDCKNLATLAFVTRSESSNALFENPTLYQSLAGALQYLTVTRPDLSYAVNRLCQFMYSPTVEHWGLLKRMLRYVKGTLHLGLQLAPSVSTDLHAFLDFDQAGCSIEKKSTSGFAVFVGFNLVSWVCRKQRTVARLFTEAEYKAIVDVIAEVTWIVSLLREIGFPPISPPRLWCDNLDATYLCANLVFHARTKHVEIDFHFVRDKVASGELQVNFIYTKEQLADIFTKSLPASRLSFFGTSSMLRLPNLVLDGVYKTLVLYFY
ncbi:PREDICTED: uncharacterized protein LOC109163064 [Ipomoea nil]|uniref:uncharacterized protein LOC109163064 n=1 Tax=Ipomoea nil TaxID=35883 RepID=UPI0009013AED|nr:PREDICTED: uncharacterized protein LOC109163064 [Ipomoea nil]